MAEIVLECNPDEALIKSLGYPRKRITHMPSKGEVFNYLERNIQAVGIVDEDPGSANSGHFSKYTKLGETKLDIDEYLHFNKSTRLLILKPRLEEWILKHAKLEGIKAQDFSLPDKGTELHKSINQKIPKFEALLKEMIASKALKHLKSLIDK